MKKEWADYIIEKLELYNSRKKEIETTLGNLLNALKTSPYNIGCRHRLIDEQNLIWRVELGKQIFDISEEEMAKEQTLMTANDYGDIIETGEKLDTKQALQNIILEKLKSF